MGKVKGELDSLKGKTAETGAAMDHSMTDSREGVMLLGEEVGVHMPRALSMFVSKLPGVGAAMEMAFPIIGIVAVIAIIGKLIEKHQALQEELSKNATANQQFADKERDMVLGLHTANLELEDQIAKLEGRPSTNRLEIALDNVKQKVDELTSTFQEDFQKQDDQIQKQIGFWHSLWLSVKDASQTNDIGGYNRALAQQHDKLEELVAAQEKLKAIDPSKDVNGYRVQAGAVATVAGEYEVLSDAAAKAARAVGENTLAQKLDHDAIGAKGEIASLGEQITHLGLVQKKVSLENQGELEEAADKRARTVAQELQKEAEDREKNREQNAAADLQTAHQSESEQISATREGTQARIKAIDAALTQERSMYQQYTDYFKGLVNERARTVDAINKQSAEQEKAVQDAQLEETIRVSHLKAEAEIEAAQHAQKMKFAGGGDNTSTVQAELAANQRMYKADLDGYNTRIATSG